MRCLITGCDGFLGANLAKLLLAAGHEVTGAGLHRHNHTSLDALGMIIRMEYGDITDRDYCERLVNAYEVDWLFHLAGVSIVRVAERDPGRAIRTNVLGTLNVLEAAKRQGVKRVLVASSDKAYGDNNGERYREDTSLRPTAAYEVSKACADHIGRLYRAIVVRCANLYGPADLNWSRLVPNSCKLAARGEPPQVYANAWEHRREWLHVEDAARAYLLLAQRGEPGQAYNVGSGECETAGFLACKVADYFEVVAPWQVEGRDWHEIPAQMLDSRKVNRLGWGPEVTLLGGGLQRTCEWYAGHLAGERALVCV